MRVKTGFHHQIILTCMTFFSCCTYLHGWTQHYVPVLKKDTIVPLEKKEMKYKYQRDLIDLALIVLHKDPDKRLDSTNGLNRKWHLSASPILEYTLSTELTTGIAAGGAFYTNVEKATNVSSFVGAIKYTQKKQFLLPVQSSIWTAGNKFNLLGDWRYLHFPQDTYGIGGFTTAADQYTVTYQYVRLYEFALRHIGNSFYAGAGYQLDYHWGIEELNVPAGHVTDYQIYGFSHRSTSSGLAIDLLYDSRKNSINPDGGSAYANLEFLQNSTLLGSSSNWNSVLIDLRRYFKVARTSVLAFWFYSVVTISGSPPYLDLPGSGSDTYNNTGRGYEQGRFIGKRYADLEGELRFPITRNGLLGGVIFCNAESVSELSSRFEVVYPGVGIGLRIKFNKFSGTNACLDYGIGARGSRGFFGNLGEVF
jgi:hypothetical protein